MNVIAKRGPTEKNITILRSVPKLKLNAIIDKIDNPIPNQIPTHHINLISFPCCGFLLITQIKAKKTDIKQYKNAKEDKISNKVLMKYPPNDSSDKIIKLYRIPITKKPNKNRPSITKIAKLIFLNIFKTTLLFKTTTELMTDLTSGSIFKTLHLTI